MNDAGIHYSMRYDLTECRDLHIEISFYIHNITFAFINFSATLHLLIVLIDSITF